MHRPFMHSAHTDKSLTHALGGTEWQPLLHKSHTNQNPGKP